jgi:type II secretory pathway predicted ATPase ExeA
MFIAFQTKIPRAINQKGKKALAGIWSAQQSRVVAPAGPFPGPDG